MAKKLTTATARLALKAQGHYYPGDTLARGITLMYRRNKSGAGVWGVRVANGTGKYWMEKLGLADDFEPANGVTVLDFDQANEKARKVARAADGVDTSKPMTLAQALDAYEADLEARGRLIANVRRVRRHLAGSTMLDTVIALIKPAYILAWRKQLLDGGMAKATFNRTKVGLRAALGFAATLDTRINPQAFRAGLKRLPDANNARRAVLTDAEVHAIIAEAKTEDEAFALLVEGLAQTGARMSQLARVNCGDLNGANKLMVPSSYKGNEGKKIVMIGIPISTAFACRLMAASNRARFVENPTWAITTDPSCCAARVWRSTRIAGGTLETPLRGASSSWPQRNGSHIFPGFQLLRRLRPGGYARLPGFHKCFPRRHSLQSDASGG